jgi:hypothetical protein
VRGIVVAAVVRADGVVVRDAAEGDAANGGGVPAPAGRSRPSLGPHRTSDRGPRASLGPELEDAGHNVRRDGRGTAELPALGAQDGEGVGRAGGDELALPLGDSGENGGDELSVGCGGVDVEVEDP